tara:strand:- start:631 stop:945 length:315 start_codon:yes stop_codon:yes gene_type:complete
MEENKNNLKDQIDIALSKTNKNNNSKKLIDKSFSSALSRIATELLAGLIVGAGIGLMMDNWLNTKPLFLIVFFILGGIAGIYNLWRQLNGQGLKLGYFNKEKRN